MRLPCRLVRITPLIIAALSVLAIVPLSAAADTSRPPNFVIIYADDMGYGDLGCYGSATPTPNLDRMAKEGIRFTNFYSAHAVCTASRAALMTGCYSNRVSLFGALSNNSTEGISDREETIAQVLKRRGYAAGIVGKWHLGHHEPFLPTHHGFDEYFGLPYSNDMQPAVYPDCPPLPLIDGTKTIETDPNQSQLTTRYTDRALQFIDANKDRPFFLYLAHTMPHVPLAVSERFRGKSGRGLYADVVMEIDWSVGQVLDRLRSDGIDEQTLVVFSSDNGPWLRMGDHGGAAGPFRGGKSTMFEGGVREPGIFRWPAHIPAAQTCAEPAMTIDLLPTFAKLAGATLSPDRIIDGKDIWPLLSGKRSAKTPHEVIYFYWERELHAVRSGKWKLHFPHPFHTNPMPGSGGKMGPEGDDYIELSLFDLDADVGETKNVATEHPDVVKRLQAYGEQAREDLGDSLTKRKGKNVRAAGHVEKAN
jgi:arylsulfatase A-like enzyme